MADRIMIPSFRLDPDQDLHQIMEAARNDPAYQAMLTRWQQQEVAEADQRFIRLLRIQSPVEATAMLLNPRTLAEVQQWAESETR